jgi:ribosomal protein S8
MIFVNDILSDMISRIKTAYISDLKSIKILNSQFILNIIKLFYNLGYINGFKVINNTYIEIYLKYNSLNKPFIDLKNFYRISKSSTRIFLSINDLKYNFKFKNLNIILSTSKGIITKQEAIFYNIGGEALFIMNIL